jgi:hypothetical protein
MATWREVNSLVLLRKEVTLWTQAFSDKNPRPGHLRRCELEPMLLIVSSANSSRSCRFEPKSFISQPKPPSHEEPQVDSLKPFPLYRHPPLAAPSLSTL